MTITCNGKIVDLSTPKIMGIINLTPDSFYDGGKYGHTSFVFSTIEKMLTDGADIIDLGGQSSRPNAKRLTIDEEWNRLFPIVTELDKQFPTAVFSIDTFYGEIAQRSIDNGIGIINDISAGNIDPKILDVAANNHVPYILMHMQGTPDTMQSNPEYDSIVVDVNHFFSEKINLLKQKGIHDIIVDPGFGFGKTLSHNYQLLNNLDLIGYQQYPLLVGISRKSMIYKLFNTTPEDSLQPTLAMEALALWKGANILRVHDVKETQMLLKSLHSLNFRK